MGGARRAASDRQHRALGSGVGARSPEEGDRRGSWGQLVSEGWECSARWSEGAPPGRGAPDRTAGGSLLGRSGAFGPGSGGVRRGGSEGDLLGRPSGSARKFRGGRLGKSARLARKVRAVGPEGRGRSVRSPADVDRKLSRCRPERRAVSARQLDRCQPEAQPVPARTLSGLDPRAQPISTRRPTHHGPTLSRYQPQRRTASTPNSSRSRPEGQPTSNGNSARVAPNGRRCRSDGRGVFGVAALETRGRPMRHSAEAWVGI